jgi:hypothetical protein
MDGHRHVDDASLEREIGSMLAVEPSPEFLARVRTRVMQEPAPGGWRLSWMLAMTSAVVAVAVAVVVWPRADVMPSSASLERPRVAELTEPAVPATAPVVAPVRTRQAARTAVAMPVTVRTIEIDLPEVVLGENEVKAYSALVVSIRESRFAAAVPAMPSPDTPVEIKELPPVEPLEIEPIVRVAALQTEGERP